MYVWCWGYVIATLWYIVALLLKEKSGIIHHIILIKFNSPKSRESTRSAQFSPFGYLKATANPWITSPAFGPIRCRPNILSPKQMAWNSINWHRFFKIYKKVQEHDDMACTLKKTQNINKSQLEYITPG